MGLLSVNDEIVGDFLAQDEDPVLVCDAGLWVRVCRHVRVLVVGGSGKPIETYRN